MENMNWIKDNRGLDVWPLRAIVKSEPTVNMFRDGEPFAQIINLDCGHTVINTYGDRTKELIVGQTLRCRTCGLKK